MSHRLPFLRLVATQLQVPIFALDYRGYGMSQGVPKQPGIMQDSQVGFLSFWCFVFSSCW